MSNPNDHHYVPRSFFKPWTNSIKEVVVYERKNGLVLPPYRQNTKSICVQKNLYSYTASVQEQKRNAIEQKLFSLVDNNAARVLQKLQKLDGMVNISDQDRYYFAVFIVSLRIRTPEAFRYNVPNAEKTLRNILLKDDPRLEDEEIKKELQGQTLLEWTEKYHRMILENIGYELMAKYVIDDKFVLPVMRMHWMVLKRNADGTNFLSSDRPLVLIGNMRSANLGFALSISPERIFIATSKPESISKALSLAPKKLIQEMNISTIQQAKNKAFSLDKSHSIRFFENRLATLHDNIMPWTTLE